MLRSNSSQELKLQKGTRSKYRNFLKIDHNFYSKNLSIEQSTPTLVNVNNTEYLCSDDPQSTLHMDQGWVTVGTGKKG